MIVGEVIGSEAVINRFEKVPLGLHQQLKVAITRLTIKLQRHVKADKLTGQVLKVRTGTLRRSIDQHVEETADSVTGKVSTNVKYGKMHEYGFSGTEQVPASIRRIHQTFGRPVAERDVNVRAYTKKVNLPERSFLRSALKDMVSNGDIRQEIQAAVARASR